MTVYRQVLHWAAIEPAAADGLSPEHMPVFIWTFGNGSAGLGEALAQGIVDGHSDVDLPHFSAGRFHQASPT